MRSRRWLRSLAGVLRRLATGAALGAIGGCYTAGGTGGVDADAYAEAEVSADAYEREPAADPVGAFQVRLMAPDAQRERPGATDVIGTITEGPEPEPIAWHATATDGACALLEPEAPFCETACGPWSVCTADTTCTRYPQFAELGDVFLNGISEHELSLTRVNGTYTASGAALAFAACREGDPIRLRTSGGTTPAFTREARCIAPLQLEEITPLERGRDLTLRWDLPAEPAHSHVRVRLDLSHPGGSEVAIACDGADNGELMITSALIDAFLGHGSAGVPTVAVTRIASSAPDTAPRGVTLSMQHTVEACLKIGGARTGRHDAPDSR